MIQVSPPAKLQSRCQNLIAGNWQESNGQEERLLFSPYSGAALGSVPISTISEVSLAAQAAAEAFEGWRDLPIKERSRPLFRFRELLLENLETLSNCAAWESGKLVSEAQAGILKGIEVIEFALGLQNLASEQLEVSRGVWCQSRREPLGVVLGITPFNFPAMVPLWMYPIALTLGNCFILKPSEKVPHTSQLIGELMRRAGYPAGTFSIINGDSKTATALISQPQVEGVAFVGSTPAARSVYTQATALGKRALCLGGAKNSIILAPDADPALAVRGIIDSFTGCAGQRCMAASVLLAVKGSEHLIEAIAKAANNLAPGREFGALIDSAAKQRIVAALEDATREGAKILVDGRVQSAPTGYENGNWLGASIIDQASASFSCARDELFGPVLTIIRVDTLSEALQVEAASPYGNATSVFTKSGAVAETVQKRASSGMIGINIGVPVPREPFSFGGSKSSKFGHGDITGSSSIEFWTKLKKITSRWEDTSDRSWMS